MVPWCQLVLSGVWRYCGVFVVGGVDCVMKLGCCSCNYICSGAALML